jgi:hypothetical protein
VIIWTAKDLTALEGDSLRQNAVAIHSKAHPNIDQLLRELKVALDRSSLSAGKH